MSPLLHLLVVVVLWFTCMAVDVTIFFVCIRLLRSKLRAKWVAAFDGAGAALVDRALQVFDCGFLKPKSGLRYRNETRLALLLLGLTVLRALLSVRIVATGG